MSGQMQAALYHSRKRRLERVFRLGLKLDADVRLSQGVNSALVVSSADGALFGAFIATVESLDGPPTGVLLRVATIDTIVLGSTDVTLTGFPTLSETAPHGIVGSGFYTFVALFDPPNDRADLFINGRLICGGTGISIWSTDIADWTYANALSNVGQIYDAEIVKRQVPGIYVV